MFPLTTEEEPSIVEWIRKMSRKGFPVTKESLFLAVQAFFTGNPRPTPFVNSRKGNNNAHNLAYFTSLLFIVRIQVVPSVSQTAHRIVRSNTGSNFQSEC